MPEREKYIFACRTLVTRERRRISGGFVSLTSTARTRLKAKPLKCIKWETQSRAPYVPGSLDRIWRVTRAGKFSRYSDRVV